MVTSTIGRVKLFAAGGAASNICKHFEAFKDSAGEGFANIEVCYIDTSRSNITAAMTPDNVYILTGLDGSGKVRAENHVQISECVKDILQTHKPADINIVISSAGGGSGSVLAPSITSELLARGIPTIVIMIGSTDSRIELSNTIKTIKSYEAISKMREIPVNAFYFENNSTATPRGEVDRGVQESITLLAAFFSKQNTELDSSDLQNWLNYTKVTTYEPHLSYIDFFSKTVKVPKGGLVISVATLVTPGAESSSGGTVDYQCVGYTTKELMNKIHSDDCMHAAIIDGVFVNTINGLQGKLNELDAQRDARIVKNNILTSKDSATNNGLVL